MDKLRIQGGIRLHGTVKISGAKNSALPAMAASLLTEDELELENLPLVNDIYTTRRLLRELGAEVEFEADHRALLRVARIGSIEAPYDLVKTMRASVLVLGPLLARTGRARVSMPGGCAIGARPINLHIKGFEKLGAYAAQAEKRAVCGQSLWRVFPAGKLLKNTARAILLQPGITRCDKKECLRCDDMIAGGPVI